MTSKTWGSGAGAWAAEAEREEAEQRLAAIEPKKEDDGFPSLTEAVTAKPKKKNKGQTVSLAELQSGRPGGPGGRSKSFTENKGLTTEEMMTLPTGPRDRTGEESEYGGGGLGGGFRDYGRTRDRGGFGSGRDEGRKGYGGFDEDRRQGQQSRGGGDRDMPSRADEVDNWGSAKKSLPPMSSSSGSSFERRRYDGDRFEGGSRGFDGGSRGFDGGSRGFDGGSRADDADNWGSGKNFVPSAPPDRKSMGFGSSYRDPASDSDRWGSRGSFRESSRDDDRSADRPKLVLNPPRTSALPVLSPSVVDSDAPKVTKPNPFGSARPREEVLAEKNPEWRKNESDIEERRHSSRPTSAHSSRPGSPDSQSELTLKPRPKVNPFGEAKPREEVLKGKGMDYRKMEFDLEHRRVERPETDDEIKLKEEINALKDRAIQSDDGNVIENGKASGEENQQTLNETILKKEKELELLITELDDKVRFEIKRGGDRPGSTGGRSFDSFERPGSQSGRLDNGKNFDSFERPRSRGSESGGADVWTRSGEERRGMYGTRERTFTNRERPDSRNRW